ncbi:MAG: methylmalonyl-CoA mutase [Chloroflexi bacterium]|nr:methylmalonyl-CoA mutase [Chloroflexota bacterium]
MSYPDDTESLETGLPKWHREKLAPSLKRGLRSGEFATRTSRIPIGHLYTPQDLGAAAYHETIGFPGQYPYLRGVYPTMYRGSPWTIRQVTGYGDPEETNRLHRSLLEWGQRGFFLVCDLSTQMGYDPDHSMVEAEVGRVGVPIATLADMEACYRDIPIDRVTTAFAIGAVAPVMAAMYIAMADGRGLPRDRLGGTIQNDVLMEHSCRNIWTLPPGPQLKLCLDLAEFCVRRVPRFHPMSICQGQYQEAGLSTVTSSAFMLANTLEYLRGLGERGVGVDEIAPRLAFFTYTHVDLFEEVAKYRALRRLWAHLAREKLGAKDPDSWAMRMGAATGGSVLTRQQPELNMVRSTIGTLASALGGVQSLQAATVDEAYGIPTAQSIKLSMRTQQVVAEESGVADVVDPLAGSYYVEWLTSETQRRIEERLAEVERMGGALKAIQTGFYQRTTVEESRQLQGRLESGELPVVGVNRYVEAGSHDIEPFEYNPAYRDRAIQRLRQVREARDQRRVEEALDLLRAGSQRGENLMPAIIEAVRAYTSVGEIYGALRDEYGEYRGLTVW